MKTIRHCQQSLLIVVVLLAAFACVPQTPIPVYITPTPQQTTSAPTMMATAQLAGSATAVATEVPVTAQGAVPGAPTATIMGAIVGPDYTLQPTETPLPTDTVPPTDTPVPPTATPTMTPTFGPSPTPLPHLDTARVGIQVDANLDIGHWDAAMYHSRYIGAGWVKVQANWSFLQPNSPDQFDQNFALFQLHVQNAKKNGFKVLVSVVKAPRWARPSNQNEDGPPDDPQLYGNFITFLLGKIGDVTDAVEVWNEPNLLREWNGIHPLNGEGYMRLFGPAYGAIRGYSSTMTIVTAGLAPTGNSDFSVDDRIYLQQMFNAGLKNYPDVAIGIHPYSWGNPPDARCCNAVDGQNWDDDPHFFFSHNIEDIREIAVNNGFAQAQLWATEFGWATWADLEGAYPDGDDWMAYNDVWKQADYTVRAIEIGQTLDYMGPMFLWNLNFANNDTIAQRREIAAYSITIEGWVEQRPLYYRLHDATGSTEPRWP